MPANPQSQRLDQGAGPNHRAHPGLYLFVFSAWIASLLWFHPRLAGLLDIAQGRGSWAALVFFIMFIELAWLYAWYNGGVILFSWWYRANAVLPAQPDLPHPPPAIAVLYTTCNDFVEVSVQSCLNLEYPNFRIYLLDDSSDPEYIRRVDRFAALHAEKMHVVRRPDRKGFKAGNLNHALREVCHEPFFVLVDADEVLPRDFLSRLVPRLAREPRCGFIQANHQSNPGQASSLGRDLGMGVNSHWRWYHPLRNRFGFVMLLGHGALVRRSAWEAAEGFPELVSEDLAFALAIREKGFHGRFAEDVVCYEDFPDNVRAFRIRHMKWTRGTSEFLFRRMGALLGSRLISWPEKADILLPTLNLPLSLFFFLFLVDANVILPAIYGESKALTLATGGREFAFHVNHPHAAFSILNSLDFYAITIFTLLSPVLCFVIDLAGKPVQLLKFLGRSTAIYGALSPLSAMGVLFYLLTRKAVFHVTAEQRVQTGSGDWRHRFRQVLGATHPDHGLVQGFEIACGVFFGVIAMLNFQVAVLGLALAFTMMPLLHRMDWGSRFVRIGIFVPFILIMAGIALGGLSLAGVQTVFFGYGFHF